MKYGIDNDIYSYKKTFVLMAKSRTYVQLAILFDRFIFHDKFSLINSRRIIVSTILLRLYVALGHCTVCSSLLGS